MKHLFYIHSHITNLVAKQLIAEQEIPIADCLFLLSRGYKSDFQNAIENPYTHYPVDSFAVELFFWKNWRKMNELDSWIKEITSNKDYIFYTPQSGFNFFYLMVNHPKCQGFAYLEEGLCSYLEEDKLKNPKKEFWLRDKWYQLNYKGRSKSVKHFYDLNHPKYLACFGLSEFVFPNLPNRKIIALPFQNNDVDLAGIKNVLVLSQYVEYGEMTLKTLLTALELLLNKLIKKEVRVLHVKLHPAQQEEISIRSIKELFEKYKSKIEIAWLNKEVILENIAFSTDANFYIISSSVGIYASIAGRNVYSLAKQVADMEPKFKKKINSFPVFFQEAVSYIE